MQGSPRYPMDHDPTIKVRPAYGRYDDFTTVVGPQKVGAGGCWCLAYRDGRVPNEERPQYMQDECANRPGPGVLVYVDGVVAGCSSVAPRASYRRLLNSRTIPILDDLDAWVAVCFVVRAGYRRHGLRHSLLAGAVEHASASGAEVVEGYPAVAGWASSLARSAPSNSSSTPASSGRRPPRGAVAASPGG